MHDITRNTDAEEVDKFEQLSEDWWDPNGSLRTLHVINPVRLQYIDDGRSLQDCRVLDVGCGGGLLSEAMARRGARVTGIDASDGAISGERLTVVDVAIFPVLSSGHTVVADGRQLPTVVIDAADVPAVADLARVHAMEGVGDIWTEAVRSGEVLALGIKMTTPVTATFAIARSMSVP